MENNARAQSLGKVVSFESFPNEDDSALAETSRATRRKVRNVSTCIFQDKTSVNALLITKF